MGSIISLFGEGFPPKARWNIDQIPDLTGKVIIVTGGNTGIGYESIKVLLQRNAKVYMASRSEEKARAAIANLKEITGREAIFLPLDLADLASVRKSVEDFKTRESALHILFDNAGVMTPPVDLITKDGYDLQFGTNVIGHFLFTKGLIPLLAEGAKTSSDGRSRVAISSSVAYYFGSINYATLKDGAARRKQSAAGLYSQSKFADAVMAQEFARRYGDKGIVFTSLNPGNIDSDLPRYVTGFMRWYINQIKYPTPQGTLTQLYAATSPEGKDFNGKHLIPWARMGVLTKAAGDRKTGEQLWDWLEGETSKY